jgi:hypothetical protein
MMIAKVSYVFLVLAGMSFIWMLGFKAGTDDAGRRLSAQIDSIGLCQVRHQIDERYRHEPLPMVE